jgi:hypothetical protein
LLPKIPREYSLIYRKSAVAKLGSNWEKDATLRASAGEAQPAKE